MRIAVIGARSRNQGIGAHLARFCVQAGADVCGLLGTTPETADEAHSTLLESTGHSAQAYTRFDRLIKEQSPDALVIACPHESHAPYLRRALELRLHALCEKPLIWGGENPVAEAEGLARALKGAGLHLVANTQWPYTLPTYRRLFPGDPRRVPTRFAMHLSPRSAGLRMLLDGVPHALSLLAAVLPDPDARLEDVAVTFEGEEDRRARVHFFYRSGPAVIECRVDLVCCPEQPRPASYGFDGRTAHRQVDLDGYRLSLEDGDRRIPLPDPTPLLVRSFLDAVAAGPPQAIDPAAVPGMRHLAEIVAAASTGRTSTTP